MKIKSTGPKLQMLHCMFQLQNVSEDLKPSCAYENYGFFSCICNLFQGIRTKDLSRFSESLKELFLNLYTKLSAKLPETNLCFFKVY